MYCPNQLQTDTYVNLVTYMYLLGKKKKAFHCEDRFMMKVLSVDEEADRKTNWNAPSELNKIR